MKFFAQLEGDKWLNENVAKAVIGLERRGFEPIGVSYSDDSWLEGISIDTPVVGSIGLYRKGMSKLGVELSMIPIYDEILPYYKRNIKYGILEEVLSADNWPIFVKPLEHHKLFSGMIIKENGENLHKISYYDKNTPVIFSDVLTFISEWRLFVMEDQIVYGSCYNKNFKLNPDWAICDDIVSKMKTIQGRPIAYSLDVAITDNNETVIIELNDSYALGSFGLSSNLYAEMILKRWGQLTSNNPYLLM